MLLRELKEYLKITWMEEDALLHRLLKQGQSYLDNLAGVSLEYDKNNINKSLLLDYCRYSYNNSIEHFEINFQQQLLRLQLMSAINKGGGKSYEEN